MDVVAVPSTWDEPLAIACTNLRIGAFR